MGARSIAITLSAWRGFYRWWGLQGRIGANPVEGLRGPKARRPLPKALPVEQAVALALNTPASSWHQHRAAGLAWVAAHAGAAQRQARVVLQALNAGR